MGECSYYKGVCLYRVFSRHTAICVQIQSCFLYISSGYFAQEASMAATLPSTDGPDASRKS